MEKYGSETDSEYKRLYFGLTAVNKLQIMRFCLISAPALVSQP